MNRDESPENLTIDAYDYVEIDTDFIKELESDNMIKKTKDGWVVTTKTGKLIAKHKTKKEAQAQLSAIEISKHKRKK